MYDREFSDVRQWRGHGGFGGNCPPCVCQDGARDFLKTGKKVGVGRGEQQIIRKVECVAKSFNLCPHFLPLATPMCLGVMTFPYNCMKAELKSLLQLLYVDAYNEDWN